MKVTLLNYTPNPLETIAKAGAVCYNTEVNERTIPRILDHCYESGHHSIFEFADFIFKIEGVSRATTHQLVRHRMASFAQRSQRYVDEDNFEHITPEKIKNNPITEYQFQKIMLDIKDSYKELKKRIPREDARYTLPNATASTIVVKMNLRSLMNFMNLRLCKRAQKEIGDLAFDMKWLLHNEDSRLSKYLVPKCEINAPYNFCTEDRSCGRHPKLEDIYNG